MAQASRLPSSGRLAGPDPGPGREKDKQPASQRQRVNGRAGGHLPGARGPGERAQNSYVCGVTMASRGMTFGELQPRYTGPRRAPITPRLARCFPAAWNPHQSSPWLFVESWALPAPPCLPSPPGRPGSTRKRAQGLVTRIHDQGPGSLALRSGTWDVPVLSGASAARRPQPARPCPAAYIYLHTGGSAASRALHKPRCTMYGRVYFSTGTGAISTGLAGEPQHGQLHRGGGDNK